MAETASSIIYLLLQVGVYTKVVTIVTVNPGKMDVIMTVHVTMAPPELTRAEKSKFYLTIDWLPPLIYKKTNN